MLLDKGVIRKRILKVTSWNRFIFERQNQDWLYFLRRKVVYARIRGFLLRWWLKTGRLLSFFVKFTEICFPISWVLRVLTVAHWKYMSLWRWYSSFNVCNHLNSQDSFTNWSPKLMFFLWKSSTVNNSVIHNYMLVKP